MNNRFLFPHRFKMIGWLVLIPSTVVGLCSLLFDYNLFELKATVFAIFEEAFFGPDQSFTFIQNDIFDEVTGALIIVGGTMAAFSKEKFEDEYIAQIRLESLLWATYINYGFLLFSILFIYGLGFYQILVLNMFTLLFIFLVRFNFVLYKTSRALA